MPLGTMIRRRSYQGFSCPRCAAPPDPARRTSGMQTCARCGGAYEAEFFSPSAPAIPATIPVPESGDKITPCASHEANPAVAACSRCGHFICELCRIDADRMTLCAPCFDRLSNEGALPSAQTRFRDYAGSTMTSALAGFILWPFGAIFGIAAIVYAVKALRQKREFGDEGGYVRLYLYMALGVFDILFFGTMVAILAFGVLK